MRVLSRQQNLVSRLIRLVVIVFALVYLSVTPLNAATIVENLPSLGSSIFLDGAALGQSVTTPSNGPWNAIQFNYFCCATPTMPGAGGSLFLLTQSYAGLPASLSNATPGFLASTSTVSNGAWIFDASVTLQSNTQYFFYMNSGIPGTVSFGSVYVGPAYVGGSDFLALIFENYSGAGGDAAFRLQGTPVPEPESGSLLTLGIAALWIANLRLAKRAS